MSENTGGLEDRLRNLILNNSSGPVPDNVSGNGQAPVKVLKPQPPKEINAPRGSAANPSDNAERSHQMPPKKSKKRPNQAERRQMSAQLSIPIDPRPVAAPQPNQSAPPHPPRYSQHRQQHSTGNRHRYQGSQTTGFAPMAHVTHGNTILNPPMGTVPILSQPKHQPTLSYHQQPLPLAAQPNWRQPQLGAGDPRNGFQPSAMAYDAALPRNTRYSNGTLYSSGKSNFVQPEELMIQEDYLNGLCHTIIANAEIEPADIMEKEAFRVKIEQICREAITRYEREQSDFYVFPPESVQLRCFGSLSSGFATKAADMDLGLLSPRSRLQPDAPGSPIARLVEKAFLDAGLGARLLTRTRVPIIKVCEKPPEKLRSDLLEERAKWERGIDDDFDDEEDTLDGTDHSQEDANSSSPNKAGNHAAKNSGAGHVAGGETREGKLAELRQTESRTLFSYCGLGKSFLKKIGARDLLYSNMNDFTMDESMLLNSVCIAFVEGLADPILRQRLLSYYSLSRHELSQPTGLRSFAGVCSQVEGEQLVMAWQSREIHEKDEHQEQQAQNFVKRWEELQNSLHFGLDPLGFAKDLQLALERLKKISSIQLVTLAQNQYESALLYHSRTIRIMVDLGGQDTPSQGNTLLSAVIRHYVSGIYDESIRKAVKEFAESRAGLTLRAIARRHKSLQLAHEFERALAKGLYPEDAAPVIRNYTEILRVPMEESQVENQHFDFVVPVVPTSRPLVSEVRQLADPSKLAPNQPRDPYRDRLEFPKVGAGVQCDINFSAHLALQNTLLLRCYSYTDLRVRPLVLFVKHWAKVRDINTPYRGTLSSYGYVLMMMHYLVNIANPFVCPNLQELAPRPDPNLTPAQIEETVICRGRNVQFWRDETEILRLAREGSLNRNNDSIGHLLRGFFEYYAQSGFMTTVNHRGFDWGRDVLSLRTHGGLLTKQEKGWTGAKTIIEDTWSPQTPTTVDHQMHHLQTPPSAANGAHAQTHMNANMNMNMNMNANMNTNMNRGTGTREVKEVRHRYLFAIEDPFELEHNVARTVTHHGIVAIRDEFRRAWRIIRNAGKGAGENGNEPQPQPQPQPQLQNEDLLQDVSAEARRREREEFGELLVEIHGRGVFGSQ